MGGIPFFYGEAAGGAAFPWAAIDLVCGGWAAAVTVIYSWLIGRSLVEHRQQASIDDAVGLGWWVDTRLVFRLQALAQNGLLFASRDADLQRYRQLAEIATEMMANLSARPAAEVAELFEAASAGYATPRVDVRCAIFEGDGLLLARSQPDDLWTLPGGWAEPNVSPSENAAAHLVRLRGGLVRVERLLAVWDDLMPAVEPVLGYPTYCLVFQCEASGSVEMPTETGRFFTRREVDDCQSMIAYPNRLERLFGLQHSYPGPDFD